MKVATPARTVAVHRQGRSQLVGRKCAIAQTKPMAALARCEPMAEDACQILRGDSNPVADLDFLPHARDLRGAPLLFATVGFASAVDVPVLLTGDQEVPPVTSSARGSGKLTIAADKSVSGTIMTTGIARKMAHTHEGPPGKNGPPIITLEAGTDGSWLVPPGSKLTQEQYKSFKAGNLYVNVHSEQHKTGEIRAQLKP